VLKHRQAYWAFRKMGLRGLFIHLMTRVLGDAHFLRPASSIDFRALEMDQFQTLEQLLHSLLPKVPMATIQGALLDAEKFHDSIERSSAISMEFPDRWNSGTHLQILLYAFVRLTRPSVVVETGTANGASANSIAGALHANNFGRLFTFDLEITNAPLVSKNLRGRIEFVHTNGTESFLRNYMLPHMSHRHISLFLHDADHSYLGQMQDYAVAKELKFSYIFSDDVDTSLAFCDFAGEFGKIFFDAPKFIGCYINSKELR
jgi:hypothetical protein